MAAKKSSYLPVGSVKEDEEAEDTSQKPTRRPGRHARAKSRLLKHLSDDCWLVEISCAALGAIFIVALCLVLRAYDGRPAPHFGSAFGSALTLNTIVAIIAAAAKAALLYPVAECVSQLKWLWYAKDYRRLSDMSTFDKASRGISGGFKPLRRTKLE